MTIPTRVRKRLNTAGSVISSRKFRLVNIKDGPGVVEQKRQPWFLSVMKYYFVSNLLLWFYHALLILKMDQILHSRQY